MIYIPNKFERYAASLRQLFQKRIIINGVKPNYLVPLKKIYEFEAVKSSEEIPINLEKFLGEIFTAVILTKKFDYFINVKQNRIINRKMFTALILNLCVLLCYLEIVEINNKVVIKYKGEKNKKIEYFTNKLNGNILKINDTVYLIFNLQITDKKSEDFEKAYYLLQNPLSIVNLYLG